MRKKQLRYIYRARYVDMRPAWVTTVWRRSKEEAQFDKKYMANPRRSVIIISIPYKEYVRKHKRAPRFR